jgi:hypothetical protein
LRDEGVECDLWPCNEQGQVIKVNKVAGYALVVFFVDVDLGSSLVADLAGGTLGALICVIFFIEWIFLPSEPVVI